MKGPLFIGLFVCGVWRGGTLLPHRILISYVFPQAALGEDVVRTPGHSWKGRYLRLLDLLRSRGPAVHCSEY